MCLILSVQTTMPSKGFKEISYGILSASLERTGIKLTQCHCAKFIYTIELFPAAERNDFYSLLSAKLKGEA